MFCISVYQNNSCIWGIARFPPREPSTEQLLKIFRGNSIKNYADEQRLRLIESAVIYLKFYVLLITWEFLFTLQSLV